MKVLEIFKVIHQVFIHNLYSSILKTTNLFQLPIKVILIFFHLSPLQDLLLFLQKLQHLIMYDYVKHDLMLYFLSRNISYLMFIYHHQLTQHLMLLLNDDKSQLLILLHSQKHQLLLIQHDPRLNLFSHPKANQFITIVLGQLYLKSLTLLAFN